MKIRNIKTLVLFLCVCICSFMIPIHAQEEIYIESQYAYIIDLYNQEVVYEKNAEERMYPASLTKIMTVLIALEQIESFDTTITMEPEIFEGLDEAGASVAGYQIYDEANLLDLLYGIMLPSGADASRAIATYVAGSESAYVDIMNEKAMSLGLKNTHFVNTSGLHENNHYSSAKDMGVLLQYALQNELFKTIFETDAYTTNSMSSHPSGITFYATRLKFLSEADLPDFLGGSKTGFTLEAGLCLAATIEEEGLQYILITGNAGDDVTSAQHMKDAYFIYTYLYQTHFRTKLFAQGDVIGEMPIQRGEEAKMKVYTTKDIYIPKAYQNEHYTLTWDEQANTAPIEQGDFLGQAILSYQDKEIERFDVAASTRMEQNLLFRFLTFLTSVPALVSGGVLLVLGLLIYQVLTHRQKRREM